MTEAQRKMLDDVGASLKNAHPVNVFDMKDRETGEFSYGKTVPIGIMVAIIVFHALGNPLGIGHAILLSCTAIGPWMVVKFLERTSMTVQTSHSQATNAGVTTERTIQSKGSPPVPAVVETAAPLTDAPVDK